MVVRHNRRLSRNGTWSGYRHMDCNSASNLNICAVPGSGTLDPLVISTPVVPAGISGDDTVCFLVKGSPASHC